MLLAEILAVLMVVAVVAALMAGYPVALTLAGVSLAFAVLGHALGVMSFAILGALPQRIFGVMTNEVLLAIPLFIFMGVMLERSRIAEDLLETMGRLFGTLRGGLGISVVIVGTLLAAAKGVVGATTVTMGLIMLPAMLRFGYDPRLAAGTVAATATLAQIFPPATVLVLLGDQLGNCLPGRAALEGHFRATLGHGQRPVRRRAGARLRAGRALSSISDRGCDRVAEDVARAAAGPESTARSCARSPPRRSAGRAARADRRRARLDPRRHRDADRSGLDRRGRRHRCWPRARHRSLTLLRPVCEKTTQIVSMIFLILIGATMFSLVFRALGGDDMVHRALSNLPGGTAGAVLAVMLAMFLLGFVMDAFEIIFVVVPIVAPTLLAMPGVDPVWLGIMMAVNLQTSYMHPPLGPTLFFLRGVAPPQITTRHIYVGIIPFVLIQLFALVVLWFAPALATALPHALYGH